IAFGVIGRNAAFIRPKEMGVLQRFSRLRGNRGKKRFGNAPSRKCDGRAFGRRKPVLRGAGGDLRVVCIATKYDVTHAPLLYPTSWLSQAKRPFYRIFL